MLRALEAADFDWVKRVDDIWSGAPHDVPEIHLEARKKFGSAIAALARDNGRSSPLGWVVSGPGGSGKTHLLGDMRRQTMASGGFFILIDMTGVKDFWNTALLHMVRSLRVNGPDGTPQCQRLLDRIVKTSKSALAAEDLPGLFRDDLAVAVKSVINNLYRLHPVETPEYQDVVRALALLNSGDIDIFNCGWQWLLGLELDSAGALSFGFKTAKCDAKTAVAGLSWLMSLDNGLSVMAMDQLDAIVKQHYFTDIAAADEARTAQRIIAGICEGLSALVDLTRRTQVVVSCLNATWNSLSELGLRSALDRYQPPLHLPPLTTGEQAGLLIRGRMRTAFEKCGLEAPYPTWPFPPKTFAGLRDIFPRALLQRCDSHVKKCLREETAHEAETLGGDEPEPAPAMVMRACRDKNLTIEARYREAREQADPDRLKKRDQEDAFWRKALSCFAQCFVYEQNLPPDTDLLLDPDDSADRRFPLLHAKLRCERLGAKARDRHLGLRSLQQEHPRAFQTRLAAAMTQSGIDRRLSFRRLALVRFSPFPGGKRTGELLERFAAAGGVWLRPSDDAVRSLAALATVREEFSSDWRDWAARNKPTASIRFLEGELAWLIAPDDGSMGGEIAEPASSTPKAARGSGNSGIGASDADSDAVAEVEVVMIREDRDDMAALVAEPRSRDSGAAIKAADGDRPACDPLAGMGGGIPIGRRIMGDCRGETLFLPLPALIRHTAIFGGSGSGKTVLTRVLVEEAALRGVPAIVVDTANDLASLGQPWPESPPSRGAGDAEKAAAYFSRVEVKVWTPGRESGNQLRLRQIPDLAALAGDEEQLQAAVEMTVGALRGLLGMKRANDIKEGILAAALRWMATNGGGSLDVLAEVLADLPADAGARIHPRAAKHALDMSGQLKSALITNPLLTGGETARDVSQLLSGAPDRTRISVVNLSGLGSAEAQQFFVNQLVMALFSWTKAHPAASGVGGLLVVDEAKDFVPALRSTPCKESIVRFAAQARKYGMGLVLATQEPKSVDNKVIANCNNQFFGRQNSPAAIEAAEGLLQKRGVVGRLDRGVFFVKSEALPGGGKESVRISAPLCLSRHPAASLDVAAVLELAAASRNG